MRLSAHTVVHKQVLRYKSNSLQNQMPAYGTLSRSIDLAMRNKGGGDWTSPSEGEKGGRKHNILPVEHERAGLGKRGHL